MISEMTMYWITRLDAICFISIVGCFLSGLIAVAFRIISAEAYGAEEEDRAKSVSNFGIVGFIVCLLVSVLTPTTKQMCAIKLVPAIVNNEKIQTVGNVGIEYAEEWLKNQLNELKKEKKNDK